ncbi:MAG: GGDEF domain-containing protein [Acidimicrobiales bacterium]
MSTVSLARLFVDGLWLTVGLVAASWWWVFEPMVQLRGPMLLAASFPVAIALTSASTVLLWPRLAGSARFAFGAIGLGGFVTTVAGVIHLKHAVAGTLVFGTWYDFLWMIGLTLLGLAALQPSMGSTLRARPPSARSEQLITCLPVVGLVVPLLHGEAWRRTPSAISIVMIVVLAVRVVILISQNQDLSNRLSDLAHRDDLTGLLNRRALLDHLDQIESTDGDATGNRGYALLYLDLDGFKEINDAWGHAAGDHVLATTAARLRSTLRADDAAARLGGDEFVVVTREHEARDLAERLLPILGQPIPWAGADLVVGCSIGVAATVGLTSAELLAEADGALYRSKVEGRNRVSVAGVPLDAA